MDAGKPESEVAEMRKWMEETNIFKLPPASIGVAVFIREGMGNKFRYRTNELREIFGPGWEEALEALRKAGCLKEKRYEKWVTFTIFARGDKKREWIKERMREKRGDEQGTRARKTRGESAEKKRKTCEG